MQTSIRSLVPSIVSSLVSGMSARRLTLFMQVQCKLYQTLDDFFGGHKRYQRWINGEDYADTHEQQGIVEFPG